MAQITGVLQIGQELYKGSTFKLHDLGALGFDKFGNRYRYVKAGGNALVASHLIQEPVEDTAYRSMVVQAAAAIGDTEIAITLGGTAVTANQFDDGHLLIESAAGIGQHFRIVSHDVQSSTTGTCKFKVDRPVLVALTTSSQATVRKNAFDGVIDYPTTPTGAPVGVALFGLAAAEFGWIQSGGEATALFDAATNTSADQVAIGPSEAVAGSVSAIEAADVAPSHLGWSREIGSIDSTVGSVHLVID